MSQIEIFNFDEFEVRVVMIDDEPWWVLNDVCAVLGISNPRNVADRLPEDCVRQADVVDARGQRRPTNVVSETGLYRVVLRSDKPEAEPFMTWATEKIKDLRKHGVATVRPMSPAEILVAHAQQNLEAERRLARQEERTDRVEAAVAEVRAIQVQAEDQRDKSAQAYAQLNGLPTDSGSVNNLGRVASIIGRSQGLQAGKIPHSLWGHVNTWPDEIWAQAVLAMEDDDE